MGHRRGPEPWPWLGLDDVPSADERVVANGGHAGTLARSFGKADEIVGRGRD